MYDDDETDAALSLSKIPIPGCDSSMRQRVPALVKLYVWFTASHNGEDSISTDIRLLDCLSSIPTTALKGEINRRLSFQHCIQPIETRLK